MNFAKFLFVNFLIASSVHASHAYVLLGYPKGEAQCLEAAILVGEALEKATGVSIKRAYCEKDKVDGYDLRILYDREDELPLVSTEQKMAYAGSYSSVEQCQKELPGQIKMFEDRTGLKPFLSYCYVDTSGLQKSIGSRIDAFGTPKEWPQVYEDFISDTPVDGKQVVAELQGYLKSLNLTPAVVDLVRPVHATDFHRIVLKFYGAKRITFRNMQARFSYNSVKECNEQLASISKLLTSNKLFAASSFCTWRGLSTTASISYIAPWDVPWFRGEYAGSTYGSLSACLGSRDQVVEYYKTKLKLAALGAVCSKDKDSGLSLVSSKYKLELIFPCEKFGAAECFNP